MNAESKCPRRKVVKAEEERQDVYFSWTLTLACGHVHTRTYLPKGWGPPKTTQCGQCWRSESDCEAAESDDGKPDGQAENVAGLAPMPGQDVENTHDDQTK